MPSNLIFSVWKAVKIIALFEVLLPTAILVTLLGIKLASLSSVASTLTKSFESDKNKSSESLEHRNSTVNSQSPYNSGTSEFEVYAENQNGHTFHDLIKESGIFALYCFHLVLKIGLSFLLWNGVRMKHIGKLVLWCMSSGIVICFAILLCFLMIIVQHSQLNHIYYSNNSKMVNNSYHNFDISMIIVPTTIESVLYLHSTTIVIIFIRRIKLRVTCDYDEYMRISFTPRCQSVVSL